MSSGDLIREELDVLQADLDDESPQVIAAFMDLALREGALDAHATPLTMKKGRPAVRIEVLCNTRDRDRLVRLILVETSTLGVKVRRVERYSLHRRFEDVLLHGEKLRIKVALLDGRPLRATPEYEDCRRIAEKKGIPLRQVLDDARARARILLE